MRGAQVVGLTLSAEQKSWADKKIASSQLSGSVEIRLQDYREISEQFDAVASVEMVEAVGQRWWPAYLDSIARNLKPAGRAALQFISIQHELFDGYSRNADFIQAYIFPGGMLLDEPQFEALARERSLSWEARDGFGADYAETLRQWRERYDAAVQEGRLAVLEHGHGPARALEHAHHHAPVGLERAAAAEAHLHFAGADGAHRHVEGQLRRRGRGGALLRMDRQQDQSY